MTIFRYAALVCCTAALASCSANARFDLSGNDGPANRHAHSSNDRAAASSREAQSPATDAREEARAQTRSWEARQPSPESTTRQVIVVREGDTIYSIAQHHRVTIAMIYEANGLLNDRLVPGQHLVIPSR